MSDRVFEVLISIGIIFCIYLTIKYLWPLILVIVLLIVFGVWRSRHIMKQAEDEARKAMGEDIHVDSAEEDTQDVPQYEQDLFHAQVNEARNKDLRPKGDIIDAEFTRKDEQKEEEQEKH
ncbi:MAG: hypothetical protein LKF50_02580 [Solobacterium sp.]|jgi:hypothetical protein|nr:hypothetical protein [Solobacterium sp.]MCH4222149.1 hypothetical protein [Solobacterium sp.]